jgi:tetratricopeptide (TPR) repeat protein
VERGDLAGAYKFADDLVKRHPNNSFSHFARSYVLRYAGLLDEAARDCEAAISFDPGNFGLRSCAIVFAELGHPERAMDFLRLDAGSEWSNRNMVRVLLREGKLKEAREMGQKIPQSHPDSKFFEACLEHSPTQSPSAELDRAAHDIEPALLANPDPENRYIFAGNMAYCGLPCNFLRASSRETIAHTLPCRGTLSWPRSGVRRSSASCSRPPNNVRTNFSRTRSRVRTDPRNPQYFVEMFRIVYERAAGVLEDLYAQTR